MPSRKHILASALSAALLSACNTVDSDSTPKTTPTEVTKSAVVNQYIALAQAKYADSLVTAEALRTAVDAFLETPDDNTLSAAKTAWIAARAPYQQTEVYRFGNPAVDDWEGKVNAWPLDEGLIDYVDAGYGTASDENPLYTANIVANKQLTIGGQRIDASKITPALLQSLHEADEVEANVATGYHVIEFLLWGQDLNGTQPGAGQRPATDFSLSQCTGNNCERRRDYLKAATDLLISDLKDINASWAKGGEATTHLRSQSDDAGLATMLTGMGSLAYGELAGERTKLGLMLNDPEEEHDCFSDNTHWSHYYDAKGMKNVYLGEYTASTGARISGASLAKLVQQTNKDLDAQMKLALADTESAMQELDNEADKGNTFDVLIGEGNQDGNKVVQNVVDALVAQAKVTEQIIADIRLDGIDVEGSDSLDNPSAVGQ